ncbi:MAG: hypothetical protein IKE21_08915 [Erysipelotrichaceae bacterium]|nr:hypothetical protein [Erysipelotrichaceae bacterium]
MKEDEQDEGISFKPAELIEDEMTVLKEEIDRWELIDTYRNVYEDLAYNDKSVSEGEKVITDELPVSFLTGSHSSNQVRGGYLLDQGRFIGYILDLGSTSSFGMSVTHSESLGILFTDGRKIGKTNKIANVAQNEQRFLLVQVPVCRDVR